MRITPIKTSIVEAFSTDTNEILSGALSCIRENSIVAITSKIISLCEGSVAAREENEKDEMIEREADLFLPKSGGSRYDVYLTIKNNVLIPNAGIDESNANGYYVLWPKDPQASAERCWRFLRQHYNVKNVGVIITDSVPAPLKWGVTGICISHCGFLSINNQVGRHDLFGRNLKMTKINVADALASAAVLCMGETDEQTPIALLEELPFVQFKQEPPTEQELKSSHIDLCDDLFSQLLESAPWQSRRKKKVGNKNEFDKWTGAI